MPALSQAHLHKKILEALAADQISEQGDMDAVPFMLKIDGMGTVAFYAFTLTSPPGGRPTGEYKIQLMLPKQPRGQRGQISPPPGTFGIVVGYAPNEAVFTLWDAYAHQSFAYSQNLQVPGEAVWLTQVSGIHTCERHLRGGRGVETVVVCRADHLLEGIEARLTFSAQRLIPAGQL